MKKVNSIIVDFLRKYWFIFALALVVILAVVARIPLYSKKSGDFNSFLQPWYQQCYENPKAFLASEEADYTPTYMYFLVFISWFRVKPDSVAYLYTLKTISVIFEFGTAFLIFWMCKFIFKKPNWLVLLSVFLALFIPQIILNGSFWGQCDSIFTFFIVLTLFLYYKKQPIWAAVAFGVSFAFKLQSIFFLPVLFLLWLNKKYRFWYLLLIPVVYILLMIPAMICGRSFVSCLTVYGTQAGEYVYLSLNAPTIYAFVYPSMVTNSSVEKELVPAATVIGLAAITIICVFIFLTHKDIQNEEIIKIAYMLALFAPFMLPKMHDRYFYLAEVLAVLYLFINPRKWYIPALAVAGSFSGYNVYLFNTYYLGDRNINLMIGAAMILAAIILLGYDMFKDKKPTFKPEELEEKNNTI